MSTAHLESFMEQLIPADLFKIPQEGSFEERSQSLIDQCHPGATHMRLVSVDGTQGEAEIPFHMDNRALHGLLHGGAFYTVGDTITALMCMFHVTAPNQRMLTRDGSIRYIRPIERETVRCMARLTAQDGNRLNFTCDFLNEAGKRAAQAKYRYILFELP